MPVNIFKEKEDPIVLADEEYPDWLWEVNVFRTPRELEKHIREDLKEDLLQIPLQELRRAKKQITRKKITR